MALLGGGDGAQALMVTGARCVCVCADVVRAKAQSPRGAGLAMVGNCLDRKPLKRSSSASACCEEEDEGFH